MTARLRLLALLAVTVTGCDTGGADEGGLRPGAPLDAVAAEAGDSLSVPVGSAFVYDGPGPLRYSAAVEPAAAARVRMGDGGDEALLTITPLAEGEARVTIRATAPDGRHADATLALTVTPPGIVVLRALADTTLRAGGDTLRVDLRAAFAHRSGLPLAFGVENAAAAAAFARVEGASTLVVTGTGDGPSSVVVLASAGGRTARARFTVTSTTAWCPEPPPGYVNYFSLRAGQTLRFTKRYGYDQPTGGADKTTATAVWKVESAPTCRLGTATYRVNEQLDGTRTVHARGATSAVTLVVDSARSFTIDVTPTSLTLDPYPGTALGLVGPSVFWPPSTPRQVATTSQVGFSSDLSCPYIYQRVLDRDRGLVSVHTTTTCSVYKGGFHTSLVRLPD